MTRDINQATGGGVANSGNMGNVQTGSGGQINLDAVDGDEYQVGNISGSVGVSVGRGAQAQVTLGRPINAYPARQSHPAHPRMLDANCAYCGKAFKGEETNCTGCAAPRTARIVLPVVSLGVEATVRMILHAQNGDTIVTPSAEAVPKIKEILAQHKPGVRVQVVVLTLG